MGRRRPIKLPVVGHVSGSLTGYASSAHSTVGNLCDVAQLGFVQCQCRAVITAALRLPVPARFHGHGGEDGLAAGGSQKPALLGDPPAGSRRAVV
jgi:hypothetical protein